jgi:streptomycin 6-kinase
MLRQRIIRHHPGSGPAWLESLPGIIASCQSRWQLTLRRPSFSDGAASWAAPVELADGTKAILKIGVPHHETVDMNAAWQAYDPRGLAELLAYDPSDNAFLIERCEPGHPAAELPAAETDVLAANLLPHLWAPAPDLELPRLSHIAAERATRLRDRADRLGVPLYNSCADLFETLAATTPDDWLLHGDFHPRNVLLSSRGWLAIDPRPMIGEPAYDLAIHLHNKIHLDPDPVGRITRLAERVAVPTVRARMWLAAKLIQLCSWLRDTGQTDQSRAREATAQRLIEAL